MQTVDSDQTPRSALHCLHYHFYGTLGLNGLTLALLNQDMHCLSKQ